MKSANLLLSLVTAVLILPATVLAQPYGAGLDPQFVQQLFEMDERINQYAEEDWNRKHDHLHGDSSLESSEEECENQPDEETEPDPRWESSEEEIICDDPCVDVEDNALSNSHQRKNLKHKDRAAPRKFKESKQQKHANAEQKTYGNSEEVKVEEQEQDEKAYVDGAFYMQKDKPEVLNDHRVCKQKRKICKAPKAEQSKPQVCKKSVVKKAAFVVQPVVPAEKHFFFDGSGSAQW